MAKLEQRDNAHYKLFVFKGNNHAIVFEDSPWLAAVRSLGEFMKNAKHAGLWTKLVIAADYGPNSKEEDFEVVWQAD